MKNQYKLDNGWIVEKKDTDVPILHVTPIPNTLFRKHQDVEIDDEIFKAISGGEREVQTLFKKYKLHKIIIENGGVEVKPNVKLMNTPTKFYGGGFIVTQEEGKYYLDYQLSRHGGGSRKFEITKEIYEDARTGKYSLSDLFKKYNLYHLDVPGNDVD